MKEAIGGTWIYLIVLLFIGVFTCFVSVTTNYSRCYRIKDEVITSIEHYHGVNENSIGKINEYLKGIGYSATGQCPQEDGSCWFRFSKNKDDGPVGYGFDTNYCIAKTDVRTKNSSGMVNGPIGHFESAYYKVVVFFRIDWPVFRQIFNIKISGETAIIYMPRNEFTEVSENKCR